MRCLVPVACLAFLFSGCGATEEIRIDGKRVQRVEIYYRDFNVLSYMPYSEEHLVRTHDVALTIDSSREIKRIFDVLPKECEPLSSEDQRENLYAVFKFYGAEGANPLRTYRFSRFSYTSSVDGSTCHLDDAQRESLRSAIVGLQQSGA